ncbi:MAG: glycosyltransferase family 9 protein [Gammaproteobacteria bacterium]
MLSKIKNILVIRNDKIGDFMLIWPALSFIKINIPDCKITCIVSKQVFDIAKNCSYIDEVIIDESIRKLKTKLKDVNFDASISFFSTFRIGYLVKTLNIPIRIAPKTKLAQFFYNHKILQKRSASLKPEHEYNTDLVVELFKISGISEIEGMPIPPYLKLDDKVAEEKREIFIRGNNLNANKKIIFIHPGSGGSSKNLTINMYAKICKGLRKFDDYNFLIHCSVDEVNLARAFKALLIPEVDIKVIAPTTQPIDMLYNINNCDIFISGSTGPLHIAGALDKKTIAFYPNKKSSTRLRWQTINSFNNRLEFTDTDTSNEKPSLSINKNKVLLEIQRFFGSS